MLVPEETWQDQYIITNGIKLHFVTQGEGKLMLMLHGFPEFWYSWRHQIPEFAKDYKVVALDLRGYNKSDKPQDKSAYRIDELVKDVEGVILGLGYNSCVLVGHDWGGLISWYFAHSHPEMLERLIVMNIPHPAKFRQGFQTPQQLLRSWYIFFFQLPWLPEIFLQAWDYKLIDRIFTNMAINKSAFTSDDIEAFKNAAARRGALTAMVNYYRNLFTNILKQDWSLLQVPTLMIWGEEDRALGKELTYETQTYVSNFQIHYIPNCSHWVQQEKPELVNQYMRSFLTDLL